MAEPVAVEKVQAGQIVRQEFGATQLQRSGETAASAVAAQAAAMIQARYVMALQRPRDLDEVRVRLLRACQRPGFAATAWYRKPVGKGVEGLSVRFAEEASRCMTNISKEAMTVYEDDETRIVRLIVTDLESNDSNALDVTIAKTVERSRLPQGEEPIRIRKNAKGETTYVLRATEDDVWTKQQNMLSKARRNLVIQVIPGDIVDECKQKILAIRDGEVANDPEGAKKKVVDGFAELNVFPPQLKEFLGHELASCSPAEIQTLRGLYTAIKDGEATWSQVMEGRTGEPAGKGLDPLKEKLRAQAEASRPVTMTHDVPPEAVATGVIDPDAADSEKEPPPPVVKPGKLPDGGACGHESQRERRLGKGMTRVECPECGTWLTQPEIESLGPV